MFNRCIILSKFSTRASVYDSEHECLYLSYNIITCYQKASDVSKRRYVATEIHVHIVISSKPLVKFSFVAIDAITLYNYFRYEESEWGWSDKQKHEEMTEDEAWYLIARNVSSNEPQAMVHFRFDMDDDVEVLYWYGALQYTHVIYRFHLS